SSVHRIQTPDSDNFVQRDQEWEVCYRDHTQACRP
ncbi:hypothetical protein SeMB42_g04954, partial [Synchytrium endobioticum]